LLPICESTGATPKALTDGAYDEVLVTLFVAVGSWLVTAAGHVTFARPKIK